MRIVTIPRWGIISLLLAASSSCQSPQPRTAAPRAALPTQGEDRWSDDLQTALAVGDQNGRPLLIVSLLGSLKERC